MVRWIRGSVGAVVIGLSIALLIFAVRGWTGEDSLAYWHAALRIREGVGLYPVVPDPGASDVYRYAPWFAYLWVPFTYLPMGWVMLAWTILLVVASVAAVTALAREQGQAARLLALLFGAMLIWTAARGNVQPLVIWALVAGIPRWSGPLWIGLAASLKAVPIVFALIYVARRDWRSAAWSAAIAVALVSPMPLMGWKPIDPGPSISLYHQLSPTVWAVIAAAATGAAVVGGTRRSRYAPAAIGLAAVLALPRLLLYDITFLAPAASRLVIGDDLASATAR